LYTEERRIFTPGGKATRAMWAAADIQRAVGDTAVRDKDRR
jgi:hypothetical protein